MSASWTGSRGAADPRMGDGAGPGDAELVLDVDSAVLEVHGRAKQGRRAGGQAQVAATRLGDHRLVVRRARLAPYGDDPAGLTGGVAERLR